MGAETLDLVLVVAAVAGAGAYVVWHLAFRGGPKKKPTVVIGSKLAKGLKNPLNPRRSRQAVTPRASGASLRHLPPHE